MRRAAKAGRMAPFPRALHALLWTAVFLLFCYRPAWAIHVQALKPGIAYRVEKVVFSGNHAFSASQLLANMQTKERPIYKIWQKRPTFDPDVFTEDLKELEIFY